MENDLIRRSDLLAKKCLIRGHLDHGSPCPSKVKAVPVDVIEREPAVDAVPVRHGRWIKRGYACGENEYECSVCHETEWRKSASRMKYCMFCGAMMVLKGESEDG